MVVLHGQGLAQAISPEKFHGTDRSAKTVKLFHLEQFAIYGIYFTSISTKLIRWLGREDKSNTVVIIIN